MPSEKLEFTGHAGDRLAARLETPAGEPRAHALFAHCFTCGKDVIAASRISRALTERGFAVLRFDFTGLGSSDGDFANTNFSSNVDDLVQAAGYLREHHAAPSLLIGHSLGGAAVIAAAHRIAEVRAVVTIGAPADPAHVEKQFGDKAAQIREQGELQVQLAGRPFTIRRQFLEDLEANPLSERVASLGKALLVMHSPVDEVVGIDNARQLYEAAKHPKSFVSLDDADHLLRKRADAEYAAGVLAAWASRYLPPAPEAGQPEDETVEVAETREGTFTNTVRNGPHAVLADEPRSAGGTDTGMAPYGFLLAALGTCTSMTLRMYANRKGIKLDRTTVRLRHNRIHAEDCEDCESADGFVSELTRELHLEGDLSGEDRRKLVEIAGKCPVHRTLEGEVKVRTRLAEGGG